MTEAHKLRSWTLASAALGGLVWAIAGPAFHRALLAGGVIEWLFLLGPLVIVPLGVEVLARFERPADLPRLNGITRAVQPFAALLVVASFCLPVGIPATALAAPWFVITGLVALHGAIAALRSFPRSLPAICFLIARLSLPVGGAWLLLSRAGLTLMGFAEPIVILTAVHFHLAGFATAAIVGATLSHLNDARDGLPAWIRVAAATAVVGPGLLAVGFLVSPAMQFVCATLLATALLVFSPAMVQASRNLRQRWARVLLTVAAGVLWFGMALVGVYATGEYLEEYWLLIPQMARWHGSANALGFVLCGLLAWSFAEPPAGSRTR
jgi:hypothetical protein